ncbi:M1 family metallopeptidase [Cryomorpha ignava]|uniref:Aminopeptidase N n=1 Tax=Cryomorpha ignava TaxID=101383 RepID=A0A7K3WWP6_9FLAO|nr:M1 family metallopeptidase [Cryomorpha ignava]NEN25471.1 M1 family metallopeptidase [Cryomorpha ignava]
MKYTIALTVLILAAGCSDNKSSISETDANQNTETMEKYANDTHSFSEPNKVAATHLNLDISVSITDRTIQGTATYDLERNNGDTLKLDMRGLEIKKVTGMPGNAALTYEVEEGNELGDGLVITLNDDTKKVAIEYTTSPSAAALMWMDPEQTLGKEAPFMFTQGQAILTRSWIPIQDSPAIRMTYEATVKVPEGLMAVMSAVNPTEKNDTWIYNFKMDQPIPPYLIALAVGDLEFESLGSRTGVYAEPAMIKKAAYEFEDVEKMVDAAEALYGPYRWGQYDLLVLPPSFPFGGMENPRLTFATPTIIAGDQSLTSLVAHELAHSWSGNLVTNATWDDFWLNEGFTVYFESRIMEAVYGADYADMLKVLGAQDLQNTIDELGVESADTHLKLDLDGRDPDDGMTDIAYEKGALFLRSLEQEVGRERFDKFLRNYFDTNAFKTMTTDKFIAYLDSNLLNELDQRPNIDAWIYGPGLPANHPVTDSKLLNKVDSVRVDYLAGKMKPANFPAKEWTTQEWMHFLRGLPADVGSAKMTELDKAFKLTETGNSEIAAAWFLLAIKNDYQPAFPAMAKFLERVGRRKFLKPLYEELAKTDAHKKWALDVYAKARKNYHTVSTQTIDEILGYKA